MTKLAAAIDRLQIRVFMTSLFDHRGRQLGAGGGLFSILRRRRVWGLACLGFSPVP